MTLYYATWYQSKPAIDLRSSLHFICDLPILAQILYCLIFPFLLSWCLAKWPVHSHFSLVPLDTTSWIIVVSLQSKLDPPLPIKFIQPTIEIQDKTIQANNPVWLLTYYYTCQDSQSKVYFIGFRIKRHTREYDAKKKVQQFNRRRLKKIYELLVPSFRVAV